MGGGLDGAGNSSRRSAAAIAARFVTGAMLAGVYPVGMKIAVGWGEKDRGFLVGTLLGALILGNALPHLFALTGGSDWRSTVVIASIAALIAAGTQHTTLTTSLGFVAVVFATVNVVGGFMVTNRMLAMFKR